MHNKYPAIGNFFCNAVSVYTPYSHPGDDWLATDFLYSDGEQQHCVGMYSHCNWKHCWEDYYN